MLDEQTAVNFALGDMPRAMKALREAAALEPSQSRLFQLGMSSRESGDLAQAIKYLSASLEKAPGNVRYREALGYTYLQAGQLTNAAAMLTTVARQEPGNVQVQQDLADVLVHLGDRPGAIRQLRQTIQVAASTDARAEATSETGSETGSMDQRERAMLQMRSTVAQLGKTYEVAGYFGYQTLAAPNGVIDRTAPSLLLSQGGFELARYLTGSRRGLSLIGRIMSVGSVAEGQAGTAGLQGALSQAAVGLRYKPFVTENLNVSFERLFQLGGGLPNSWLARALYGKETGADLKPDRRAQAYGLIYGDLAGFIGPYPSLLAYGETRLGVSVGLGNSWIVRPHVIALGRHDLLGSAPDAIQAGAGVGLAHYFRDPGFVGPAPSLELRVYGTAAGSRALSTDGLTGIRGLTLVTTLRF